MSRSAAIVFWTLMISFVSSLASDGSGGGPARAGVGSFSPSEFAAPGISYRPVPAWVWHGPLTKEILASQLEDMHAHGMGTVMPVPEPADWRPTALLSPDYLSDDYLALHRYMVEQAHRLGMKVWAYDEGGWPSGSCNGRVVRNNPSLARVILRREETKPKRGDTFEVPGDCISAFLYQGSERLRRLTPGAKETADTDDARVLVFRAEQGSSYPDLLNPEATREFIRLTHEAYKRTQSEFFGTTITAFVTDEPKAAIPGWTPGLAEDFEKKFGYDIRDRLPSIFEGSTTEDQQVRVDYGDWLSDRFANAYLGEIQEWCHANKVLSLFEPDNDDDIRISSNSNGCGHLLRALRKCDIPADDTVWRQIFPGFNPNAPGEPFAGHGSQLFFPKYPATVAHQGGMPQVFCESFGVYGTGLTPEQMKWVTNFEFVRGINVIQFMEYTAVTRDFLRVTERPIFHPASPLWRYIDIYARYCSRLSYLMSLGKPDIRTAVYFPVRDIWARADERAIAGSLEKLAELLLEIQCDYDFIDDDTLEKAATEVRDGKLAVGPMRYDTVCVSRTEWMTEESRRKLAQFAASGGKVLWVDNTPTSRKPAGSIAVRLDEVSAHLTPVVGIEPANKLIRVCRRRIADGSLYLITNEALGPVSCSVTFSETLPMVGLDLETGACYRPSRAVRSESGWSLPLELDFAGSCAIMFTKEKLRLKSEPPRAGSVLLALGEGWSGRRVKSFVHGEDDIEVHDLLEELPVPIYLGDWRSKFGEGFSGDVEYSVSFDCTNDFARRATYLDLGEVRYVCRATLNGVDLGRRIWQPMLFPIKGKLRAGRNELRVAVTNTLANQYATTQVFEKYTAAQMGPYTDKESRYERESLPSGLYGPVVIRE